MNCVLWSIVNSFKVFTLSKKCFVEFFYFHLWNEIKTNYVVRLWITRNVVQRLPSWLKLSSQHQTKYASAVELFLYGAVSCVNPIGKRWLLSSLNSSKETVSVLHHTINAFMYKPWRPIHARNSRKIDPEKPKWWKKFWNMSSNEVREFSAAES